LRLAVYGCLSAIGLCWALGVVTKEYSWVDRAWSILPVGYVAFFASRAGFSDPRLILMTALAFLWGARLTFNFARKGGYAPGGEDYRWAVLRARMTPWQWQLFHFGFVAGVQNVILLLLALPAWIAQRAATGGTARPLGALDIFAAVLFVAFLIGETIADENQWRFHREKKEKLARGETVDPPYCDRGLFRFSRHPNFFCEQAMWWVFYLFGVAATGEVVNASLIAPVVLTALFHGSTRFTEEITLSKYPTYADYQRRTSRLLPLPPRRA
jgi:steroid 5-alpha reductase family enzyme